MRHTLAILGITALALVGCAGQPATADPCKNQTQAECTITLQELGTAAFEHYEAHSSPSASQEASHAELQDLAARWRVQCLPDAQNKMSDDCKGLYEQMVTNVTVIAPRLGHALTADISGKAYCVGIGTEDCGYRLGVISSLVRTAYGNLAEPTAEETGAFHAAESLIEEWEMYCSDGSPNRFSKLACADILIQLAENVPVLSSEMVPDEI